MKVMETEVRKIEMDGLLWGAGKLNGIIVLLYFSKCLLYLEFLSY